MKFKILSIIFTIAYFTSFAAEGDTIIVRSHDQQHMKFPPSDRNYLNRVKFPDGSKSFRKILLSYTLGCPAFGCSTWDYDTHVSVLVPTGTFDSTLSQYPHFKVDNTVPDSFYISLGPTYQTYFDTINARTDSVMSDTLLVEEFRNSSSPSTLTNSFYAYETGYYKYYFNSSGQVIDSAFENGDSLWVQNYHVVYNVFEVRHTVEMARLITPYGDNAGVGYYPYTYVFDVTDYAPVLVDSTDVLLRFAGWQDGFLATLDFIFVEGIPPRTPKRVLHLYDGYYAYGSTSDPINQRLVPFDFSLSANESYAQLNYTVTGHGSDNNYCSEFCAKSYYVKVDGINRYTHLVWYDKCGDNPISPQGGTWLYDRANWCPGLPGFRDEYELTPYLSTTGPTTIKVDFQSYTKVGSGSPGYGVSGNIITFGAANHSLDASVEKIISPSDDVFESHHNPICSKPRILIRNTGSTVLTSLKITHGQKGGSTRVYNWTGNLKFLQSEEVELNIPAWDGTEKFYEVEISAPNGGSDEYQSNNALSISYTGADMLPNQFRIFFQTNNVSKQENALTLTDANGNQIFQKIGVENNHLYIDTVSLSDGCYHLNLIDIGKDGLEFWAGSQTAGYLRISKYESMAPLKTFISDFGSEINYEFLVGSTIGIKSATGPGPAGLIVFPNPVADNQFYLDGLEENTVPKAELFDPVGRQIPCSISAIENGRWEIRLHSHGSGIHYLRITTGNESRMLKLVLQ